MLNSLLAFVACFCPSLFGLGAFASLNGPNYSAPTCDSLSLSLPGRPFTVELFTDLVLVAVGVPIKVFSLLGSLGDVLDIKCFKVLGSGSYGTVYSAVLSARSSMKDVAVKVSPIVMHGRLDKAFKREVDALKAVRHPNVFEYVDHANDADHNYLVLYLHSGGSLADLLKPKARGQHANILPLAYALFLTRQLVSAVCAVHTAGFVHMDIKPANVLLRSTRSRDGAVLCDFGLAQRTGTPGYAAPEAYDLEVGRVPSRGGFPMDWYAVRWVVYAMTLPSLYKGWHADIKAATMPGKVDVFSLPGWANVPEEVTSFVRRLTHVNPLERLQDKTILLWIDRLCQRYAVVWSACPRSIRQLVTICTSERSERDSSFQTAEHGTTSSASGFQSAISTPSASDFRSALSTSSVSAFVTASISPIAYDTATAASSSAPSVWATAPANEPAPDPACQCAPIKSPKRKGRFKAGCSRPRSKSRPSSSAAKAKEQACGFKSTSFLLAGAWFPYCLVDA